MYVKICTSCTNKDIFIILKPQQNLFKHRTMYLHSLCFDKGDIGTISYLTV